MTITLLGHTVQRCCIIVAPAQRPLRLEGLARGHATDPRPSSHPTAPPLTLGAGAASGSSGAGSTAASLAGPASGSLSAAVASSHASSSSRAAKPAAALGPDSAAEGEATSASGPSADSSRSRASKADVVAAVPPLPLDLAGAPAGSAAHQVISMQLALGDSCATALQLTACACLCRLLTRSSSLRYR